jgi:hypothetical protein
MLKVRLKKRPVCNQIFIGVERKMIYSCELNGSKAFITQILVILLIINLVLVSYPSSSFSAECGRTSVGLTPLTELVGSKYKGEEGGLYPGGNEPPEDFQVVSEEFAKKIVPLDFDGQPDEVSGKIVIISVGMSLTWQEFESFRILSESDPLRNSKITIINSAIPGITASSIANSETDFYWAELNRTLERRDLDVQQVQVVWLKEVNVQRRGFPRDAVDLKDDLKKIVQLIKEKYVNTQIVYLSSRSYGGYGGPNSEPGSFETGFAVKWLIQDQISGEADLNYDPSRGPVKAPILRWGPYLWADGSNPRAIDNLSWACLDYDDDGLHPSSSGQDKVGKMLLNYMQIDPTAKIWYLSEEAQDEYIEALVFEVPFPIFWFIVILIAAIVGAWVVIRIIRNRSEREEIEENE